MKLVVALLLISTPGFSQATKAAAPVALPANTTVIDGHKTPDAITDAMALRMTYLLAAPKNGVSSTATPKPLEALFRRMLLEKDKGTFLKRVRNWQNIAPAGIPVKGVTFAQMDALLADDLAALKSNLSGQGWAELQAELEARKKTIKIYQVGAPPKGAK